MNKSLVIFLLFAAALAPANLMAQDTIKPAKSFLKNTEISGQWFISGNYENHDSLYQIELKRGYFTIESHLTENLTARYTQDITLDTEGDDAGNVEMRLKYLYLQQKIHFLPKFQQGSFSIGMVPRPWIEFEQKINSYRVMGPMFLEKTNVLSSADFGFIYEGLIGGEIDKQYQKEVNAAYPGKYGSFSFGLYNGGGYHDVERNNNKTFEARLTLRPLPAFMPGLQFGYAYANGKANIANDADFNMNVIYLSSESKYHVFMAQYYSGVGDYAGLYTDTLFNSYKNSGYALFGEFKIPQTKFSVVGRYDSFKSENEFSLTRINTGIAYRFLKNKLVLGAEYWDKNGDIRRMFELALEIRF
ncbi:MAG TPA: hypothetical protein PKY63_03675 [Bacteroidales bacterium]|nr:hypothetical protein [Bacteroidales bacterium]